MNLSRDPIEVVEARQQGTGPRPPEGLEHVSISFGDDERTMGALVVLKRRAYRIDYKRVEGN